MSTVLLSSLHAGAEGSVASVSLGKSHEDQELALRLMEIGFLPGERIRVIARGRPGGEPIAVRLGHTTFALRIFEAAFVSVQKA
jgi:ferrous iron transport protein A